MKHCAAPAKQITRGILPTVCATALVVVLTGALPKATHDARLRPLGSLHKAAANSC